jgi:tetratricopeptide (TPR) repeat protein
MALQGKTALWRDAATEYQLVDDLDPQGDLGLWGLNNLGGVLFFAFNDYIGAEKAWRRTLKRNPRFEDALTNLGLLYLQKSRGPVDSATKVVLLHQALDIFQKALELQPNRYQTHDNVGVTYLDLGQYEEARDAFARALHIAPNDGQVLKNMGALFVALAQTVPSEQRRSYLLEAKQYYQSALEFGYTPARQGIIEIGRRLQEIK